jgi:beta-glucosidase
VQGGAKVHISNPKKTGSITLLIISKTNSELRKMNTTISRNQFLKISLTSSAGLILSNKAFGSMIQKESADEINRKIDKLLSQLTIEEKCLQLSSQFPNANVRLKIPNMVTGECCHGIMFENATMFPQAIAMGGTWDMDLIERVGASIAKEASMLGFHQCFAPMIAVLRDPRWGRTEEGYSEDPHLVSEIGVAYINGLQGKGKERYGKNRVMATAKHFIADGEPLMGANGAAMDISEYTLHNIHLLPFKNAINKAGLGSVMPAHHTVNGVACHANTHLIDTILRKEYGFNGIVVSDNGDIEKMHSLLNYAETKEEAMIMALEAGVDLELVINAVWKENKMYGPPLIKAVKEGRVPESLVDKSVRRVLETKFLLGLFDDPSLVDIKYDLLARGYDEDRFDIVKSKEVEGLIKFKLFNKPKPGFEKVLNNPDHQALALEAALKSIVLLKNKGGLLPLDKTKIKKIAVIGPNAKPILLGGYSVDNKYCISLLEGIKQNVGSEIEVLYTQGCDLIDPKIENIEEAKTLAQEADVVILALGQDKSVARENRDRDDLNLTGKQQTLAEAIYAVGKPVVAVLQHAQPLAIEWIATHIPAIVDGWYLGQAAGTAFAKVLFGDYNPGGKLQMTYPRNVGQVPCYYNQMPLGRVRNLFQAQKTTLYPSEVGISYNPNPLFAFGHGLSYTSFDISGPILAKNTMALQDKTTVKTTLTNMGTRDGEEVVQLYITDKYAKPTRPRLELKGFKRVFLKAGEKKEIVFEIGHEQLEYWHNGQWSVQAGEFDIMVGNSSQNLKKASLIIKK